jgi:hypothetical protein
MSVSPNAKVDSSKGTSYGAYQESFEFITKHRHINTGFVLYILVGLAGDIGGRLAPWGDIEM